MDGSGYKYIDKSEGPITDPWGTPYFIGEWEEKELYIFTLLLRSDKVEVNHERARSLTPRYEICISYNLIPKKVVSNKLLKYINVLLYISTYK